MYSVDTDARNDQDVERNITVAELKMFEDVASWISCACKWAERMIPRYSKCLSRSVKHSRWHQGRNSLSSGQMWPACRSIAWKYNDGPLAWAFHSQDTPTRLDAIRHMDPVYYIYIYNYIMLYIYITCIYILHIILLSILMSLYIYILCDICSILDFVRYLLSA